MHPKLYKEIGISPLLRAAHPFGSPEIVQVPNHEGVVEDLIEAQLITLKTLGYNSGPLDRLASSLGFTLKKVAEDPEKELAERVFVLYKAFLLYADQMDKAFTALLENARNDQRFAVRSTIAGLGEKNAYMHLASFVQNYRDTVTGLERRVDQSGVSIESVIRFFTDLNRSVSFILGRINNLRVGQGAWDWAKNTTLKSLEEYRTDLNKIEQYAGIAGKLEKDLTQTAENERGMSTFTGLGSAETTMASYLNLYKKQQLEEQESDEVITEDAQPENMVSEQGEPSSPTGEQSYSQEAPSVPSAPSPSQSGRVDVKPGPQKALLKQLQGILQIPEFETYDEQTHNALRQYIVNLTDQSKRTALARLFIPNSAQATAGNIGQILSIISGQADTTTGPAQMQKPKRSSHISFISPFGTQVVDFPIGAMLKRIREDQKPLEIYNMLLTYEGIPNKDTIDMESFYAPENRQPGNIVAFTNVMAAALANLDGFDKDLIPTFRTVMLQQAAPKARELLEAYNKEQGEKSTLLTWLAEKMPDLASQLFSDPEHTKRFQSQVYWSGIVDQDGVFTMSKRNIPYIKINYMLQHYLKQNNLVGRVGKLPPSGESTPQHIQREKRRGFMTKVLNETIVKNRLDEDMVRNRNWQNEHRELLEIGGYISYQAFVNHLANQARILYATNTPQTGSNVPASSPAPGSQKPLTQREVERTSPTI